MFPNIAVPALKVADFFKEPGSILSLCLLLNDYKPILDMASVYSAFYVYGPLNCSTTTELYGLHVSN